MSLALVIRVEPYVAEIPPTSVNNASPDVEVLINGHRHPYHERYTPRSMFRLPRMLSLQALNQCCVCYDGLLMCVYSVIPMVLTLHTSQVVRNEVGPNVVDIGQVAQVTVAQISCTTSA